MPHKLIILSLLITFWCSGQSKMNAQGENFTVPFHLIAKLIMVEATAGEQKGLFIVDTGSPELVLNSTYFNPRRECSKINGLNPGGIRTQTGYFPFELAKIRIKSKRALLVDLCHLEQDRNIKILGIIGYSILNDFEILIDLPAKKLSFLQTDKRGNHLISSEVYQEPTLTVPFDLRGHLPCIEIQIGSESFYVAIDSGAGINVFDTNTSRQLIGHCTISQRANVKSFSLQDIQTQVVQLESIFLGKIAFPPMCTIFHNIKPINDQISGKKIQGLLGYEFLKHQAVSINYRKKEVSIWEADGTTLLVGLDDK